MPEVSVIIPVYNTEQFLADCLNSVLAQTFADFEIIIVDDGSTDNSAAIIEEFAQKDSRIVKVRQENKGLSEARNAGIAIAKGNWLTFVDSDDAVVPIFLERLIEITKKNKTDITCCSSETFVDFATLPKCSKSFKKEVVLTPLQALTSALYQKQNPDYSAWNKLYSIKLWKERRFPAGIYFEDMASIPQVFLEANSITFISEKLYYYRKHSASILATTYNLKKAELLDIAENVCTIVRGKNREIERAANCNLFSASCSILMRTPDIADFADYRKRAWKHIVEIRTSILFNTRTRLRNRIAAFCSLGGRKLFNRILQRFG